MAARSSSVESPVKTIRITYQELLELAGNLDSEKKKKSPKRKSKENHEEEESRDAVSSSKDEKFSINNQEESEVVDLETKKVSRKAEKRSKEEKKECKKKGEQKKKHKSRLHSDEKQSEREDDDEVSTQHNKEKREKTTRVDKVYDNSAEDPFDGGDKDKLKSKEEKESSGKRSPKLKDGSGEKTADLEDHVAKLRLDDHGKEGKHYAQEEHSRKSNKHTKKKTKNNEEKEKKHSESKKKDKKKSDDAENSRKDSPDEIGKEKEKRKRKKDKIKIDDNCFEDEHKTHGILKSSPKLKGNHVHFSFSEDIGESCSCESNSAERGIIRIPEGITIHHQEKKIEYEGWPLEIEHDDHDSHDSGNGIDDDEIVQTAEWSHDMPYEKRSPDCNNPKIKTSDLEKVNTMEKRLKALNRQRAQQLVKQCCHPENSLGNLLSKGITDKASLLKICTLSKEIQDLYQGVIMLDLGLANHHDVDQLLWKNAFYQVIETFRKYGKLFLGYSSQKNAMAPEEINEELHQFLEKASYFYSDLLEALQKTHHFEVQEIVNQPRKAELLGRHAKLALLSCHHILIFLGDIQRYKEQLQTSKGINWSTVRSWYLKASKLAPKNGKPYNQLAVIAVYANRKLDAVYYYIRSLAVSSPILTAKEKLTTIFHEIQRKADQVQQQEEMQRRQQEHQKAAHKRRDASGGHGRNIFREAAREVGLVSEKEPNSGRHEIWVFMRQGKYRRLILTDQGKIQLVDATGTTITKEHQEEDNHRDPINESPKISLQEINKKFMLHFLCAHGLLYTRIGMERLPSLQVQLIGELHTLLGFPQCSSVSCISLLQISAINMYAIDHTAPRENSEPFVRVGTPQDQALTLAMDMLISVLNACTELLVKPKEDDSCHGNNIELSAPLRQFIPIVKVWFDWLSSHQDLWQASSISIHRTLWESIVQFANLLMQIKLPEFEDNEYGKILTTLNEDEFLAGFKPLAEAKKYSLNIRDQQYKELVQDHLHILAVGDFCRLMSSIPNHTMQYCQETGEFTAIVTSIPASQPQDSSPVAAVHVDVDQEPSDPQESYESDDVIVENVLDDIESGDEVDKGFQELKAKKEQLAKELEDHQEKHSKARAVVHENVSRPHLVSENYPTFLVPDTNCFIDQLNGIQAIVMSGDFTLVVPLVVINELDGLKKEIMTDKYHDVSHAQMVMENSRAAIDFLEDQFSLRSTNVKAVTSKGTVMDTIAFRSEDGTARTGNNDDVILSCCLHYCQENFVNRLATADQPITIRRKVVLLTDDRNLRVKAYTRNVPVLTVPQFRQMARL